MGESVRRAAAGLDGMILLFLMFQIRTKERKSDKKGRF
jgi:hypothetical protein